MAADGAQPSSSACEAKQISDLEYFAAQQRETNNIVRRRRRYARRLYR